MDPSRNQMDIANSVIDESINSAKKIYSLDAMISKLWPSQSHSSGDSGSPELEAEELVESYEWRRSPSLEAEEISADEAAEAARQEAEEQLQKANELRSLRTVLRQWRNPNLAPIGTNPTSVLERFAMLAKLFPDRNDLFFRNSPNESSSKEMVPHRFGSSTKELVRSSDRSIRSNAVSREVNYRPRGIYVPECDENELTYNGESLFSSEDESCADESEDYDSSDDSNYTPLDVDGTVSNDRFKEEKHSIDEDEVLGLFDDLKQHIYRIQPILDYTRDDSEYQETPPIIHVPKQNPIARYLRHAVQMSKNAKQSILLSIVPLTSILLMAMILICIARNRNGYCDSAKTLNRSIVDGEPIHHGFSLACIPCPPNGVCFFGELQCPTLYKRRRAWYNPFGFLPVADRCVLDAVVAKRVKLIERTIRRTLYAAQGKLLCDAVKKGNGDVTNTYASIHVDDLTQRLRNSKELISKMSKSQLEDLIPIALKSVLTNENIFYWNTDGNATYSTNKAYCTLGCRILLFYATMSIFTKFCLILGALLFCASLPFMYRLFISYKEKRQVNKLVSEIIKTLKNQHKKHSENPTENPHKYCSVPYLRVALMDSVNIKDVQKALSVWEKAERELQKSPNIIRRFLEENGEAYETWEYVA
ncbi:Man1-Src1p-C-terminal domain-containing protein [Phycomyces blakesleeanus]